MTDQKGRRQVSWRRYSPEFKSEALGLAEQVGAAGAAKQLGLQESQLYAWHKKARHEASRSETEKALSIENARLKRQVAKRGLICAMSGKGTTAMIKQWPKASSTR